MQYEQQSGKTHVQSGKSHSGLHASLSGHAERGADHRSHSCGAGQHYAADRVSVFEVDDAYAHISRVCQWCSEPSASKALSQPDGPQSWLAWFGEQGPLFLSAPSAGSQSAPEAGLMLSSLGVNCLMAAPVMASDRVVGFLCVDHPRQNTGDLLLLSVASAVCYREAAS